MQENVIALSLSGTPDYKEAASFGFGRLDPDLVSSQIRLKNHPPPSSRRLLPYSCQRWSFLIYDTAVNTDRYRCNLQRSHRKLLWVYFELAEFPVQTRAASGSQDSPSLNSRCCKWKKSWHETTSTKAVMIFFRGVTYIAVCLMAHVGDYSARARIHLFNPSLNSITFSTLLLEPYLQLHSFPYAPSCYLLQDQPDPLVSKMSVN